MKVRHFSVALGATIVVIGFFAMVSELISRMPDILNTVFVTIVEELEALKTHYSEESFYVIWGVLLGISLVAIGKLLKMIILVFILKR